MVGTKPGAHELKASLRGCIQSLPLHQETIKVLLKCSTNNLERALNVAQEVYNYESSNSCKALESLIHRAHLLWDNPLPPHLKQFQTYYKEMRNHWPYEQHRSLLYMDNPRKESLAYLWRDCHSAVVSKMRYDRHRWADDSTTQSLDSTQRHLLFSAIFRHYFFLKSNSRLCQNGRKLPVPIVEIPMRPLGHDAADSRVRNLFKSRVATTWNLLALDNRPLSSENELLLSDIIDNACSRAQKRLYQKACRRAYIVSSEEKDEGPFEGLRNLEFSPSPLLLRNI